MGFTLFTTPGADTFTVPNGVTSITVICLGGGGGADGGYLPERGAGGGACAIKTLSVSDTDDPYDLHVADAVSPPASGENSTFSLPASMGGTMVCKAAGGNTDGIDVSHGGRAADCIGDTIYEGGDGGLAGDPTYGPAGGGGGGGGASSSSAGDDGGNGADGDAGGAGGAGGVAISGTYLSGGGGGGGGSSNNNGNAGSSYGGGGGGGGSPSGETPSVGGGGAQGAVYIYWAAPQLMCGNMSNVINEASNYLAHLRSARGSTARPVPY